MPAGPRDVWAVVKASAEEWLGKPLLRAYLGCGDGRAGVRTGPACCCDGRRGSESLGPRSWMSTVGRG